jgi:hypothetical protein
MWVFSVTTVLPATWTLNKTSALGNGEKFGDSKRALIVLFLFLRCCFYEIPGMWERSGGGWGERAWACEIVNEGNICDRVRESLVGGRR